MTILYARYNANYLGNDLEKIKIQINEARNRLNETDVEVISVGVKSGKSLAKKEMRSLLDIVYRDGVTKVYLSYCDMRSLAALCTFSRQNDLDCKMEEGEDWMIVQNAAGVRVSVSLLETAKSKGSGTEKKIHYLFKLLECLQREGSQGIIPCDEESFYISGMEALPSHTLKRYLDDLKHVFPTIIKKRKENKCHRYVMVEKYEILEKVMYKIDAMEELVGLFAVMDEETIKQLSAATKKAVREHNSAILYKSRPFEKFEDNALFRDVKEAIIKQHYIDIYEYEKQIENLEEYASKDYYDVLPLKIIYMENNWYFAGVVHVKSKEYVRFFRLRFIGDYKILDKSFELQDIKTAYLDFLDTFETLFTRYGIPQKKALLNVSSHVAAYFENKQQFPGQNVMQREENGSMTFEVQYTQVDEILPLIKRWIPDVTVIESPENEIEEQLKRELEALLHTITK